MPSWLSAYERVEDAPSQDSRPEWLREYEQVEPPDGNLSFTEGVSRNFKRGTIGMEAGVRGKMVEKYEGLLAPAVAEQQLQGGPNLELGQPSTPDVIAFMQKNPDFAQVRSQSVKQQVESLNLQDRLETDPSLAKSPDAEMPQDGGLMGLASKTKNWRWWSENIAEFAPQFAAQIAAATITRGEALPSMMSFMATGAIPESGNIYSEARKRGVDHITAAAEANLAGAGVAAMDLLPGSELLLKNPASKKIFAKFLTNRITERAARVGASYAAEGSTEAAQEAWADTMRWMAENDPKAYDGWRMRYPAVALLGGAVGGIGALATSPNEELGKDQPAAPQAQAAQPQPQATQQPATQPAAQPAPSPEDFTKAINDSVDAIWQGNPTLAQAIVDKIADGGRISRTDWAKAREASPNLPNKVSANARDEFAAALKARRPAEPPAQATTQVPTQEAQQPVAQEATTEPVTQPAESPAVDPVATAEPPIQPAPVTTPEPEAIKPVELEDVAPEVAQEIRDQGDPIEDEDRNDTGWIGQRTPSGMILVHPEENKIKRFETGGDFPGRIAEAKNWAATNKVSIKPRVTPKPDKPLKSEPPKKSFKKPAGSFRLPRELSGAKPRYAYGSKQFDLAFANDLDRSLYILAQQNQSKRDADYLKAVQQHTGMSEDDARAAGAQIRATIKAMAKEAEPGTLNVPASRFSSSQSAASMKSTESAGSTSTVPSKEVTNGQEEADAQGQQAQTDGRQEGLLSPSEAPAAGDTTAPAPKPASIQDAGDDYAAKLRDKITDRLGGKSDSQPQAEPKAESPKPKRTFKKAAPAEPKPTTPGPRSEESPREKAARLAKSKAIVAVEINGEQAQAKVLRANDTTLTLAPIGEFDFMENIESNVAWVREIAPKPAATSKPAETSPAPTPAPAPQTEQDRLRAELAEKAKKFADAVRSKLYSNPLDPELVGLAADMTLTAVKLGTANFKAFVRQMTDLLGKELTARSARYLRAAWDIIREDFPSANLEPSADVDATLKEIDDATSERPQEQGMGDGAGEPRPNAPEVSGEPTQDAGPTNEGARDEGGELLPDARSPEGDAAAAGGGGAKGDRPGATDADQSGLAGPGAADGGRAESPAKVPKDNGDASVDTQNHAIGPDDVLAVSSEIQSVKNNIAAIELLQTLERESRYATPAEKKVLAKFVGWGKLSNAFNSYKGEAMAEGRRYGRDENWEKKWGGYYTKLKELMTEDEWKAARDSTINAHYTSRAVIERMWDLARSLGFKGGRVLEPGAGIGHFAGLAPQEVAANTKFVLVERDQFSARMLGKLYPQAEVLGSAMEETRLSPASVDMVIGNVPFAKTVPSNDPERRYGRELNLHNYFIARSLDAVKPGGLVVVISTHNTLDSEVEQRKFLATKGDLLGAIRLPNNAFDENAGTEVVTDILVFRRPINEERIGQPFERTNEVDVLDANGNKVTERINEYFVDHPEMVLGTNSGAGKMYKNQKSAHEYTVLPTPGNLDDKIRAAVDRLPKNVMSQDMAAGDIVEQNSALENREGWLRTEGDKLLMASGGKWIEVKPGQEIENYPKKLPSQAGVARARDYIALRDSYATLRETMLAPESTDEQIAAQQRVLNKSYDAYVKKHGPVSEQKTAIFSGDPEYYRILSLENEKATYNPTTKKIEYTYSKAAVFTTRTLGPRTPPTSVDTIKDALWVALGYRGSIDVPYIAELTGKTTDEVTKTLGEEGLAFRDPANQKWELSERYLSGNVKKKLKAAEVAAADDPTYQPNVDALKAVQPAPVAIANVGVELGANWIPPEVMTFFARKLFDDPKAIVSYNPHSDSFDADINRSLTSVTNKFAVSNANGKVTGGHKIFNAIINMRAPKITKVVDSGELDQNGDPIMREVPDEKATVAASAVAARMQEEFRRMVATNRQVGQSLEAIYNEKFNAYVDAKYNGAHLEMPGKDPSITMRPYQKNAIWRILQDGYALLAHAVGAGKTFTMIGAAMEMRRLKLAKRPMIVVQNATLGQFATSFLRMYPNANVLVANKDDLAFKNRQKFLARITSGNWDAIVIAQSTFDNLSSKPEVEQQYIRDKLDELEELIRDEGGERSKTPTVKDLVRARNSLQKQLDKILEKQSKNKGKDLVYFEDLDVDAMFIDEAHAYKKPFFLTKMENLVGLNKQASSKGVMTSIKIKTVQDRNNGKNVVLATGTPITNTLGEAWHMVNFVAPTVNEDFGATFFDGFVGAFAKKETIRTQNAGGQWVFKDALTKFKNGPELIRYIRAAWDILSPDDLRAYMDETDQALPKFKTGKVQAVTVDLTPNVEKFQTFLMQVYQKFKDLQGKEKRAWSFIPAVAYGASKAAALDIRLVFPGAAEEAGNKITAAADRVYQDWKASGEIKGTQLVFSDTFNPRSMDALNAFMAGEEVDLKFEQAPLSEDDESNLEANSFLFADLKKKLIARGIPANEIAIVAEAKTDVQREALFDRVKAGDVRVLIGSTSKMGVGVNVQDRLVSLHHLDAPWMPMEVEQREGRIIRFGNMNKEASIYRYAMSNTLDGAIFANIARKSKFIWQVLSGKVEGREFDDPASEFTMSIDEQIAAIEGDPLLFERMEADRESRELELQREAFYDSIARNQEFIENYTAEVNRYQKQVIPRSVERATAANAVPLAEPSITIGDETLTDPDAIDAAVKKLLEEHEQKVMDAVKAGDLETKSIIQSRALWDYADAHLSQPIKIGPFEAKFIVGGYQRIVDLGDGKFGPGPVQPSIEPAIYLPSEPRVNLYSGSALTGIGLFNAAKATQQALDNAVNMNQDYAAQKQKEIEELKAINSDSWPNEDKLTALKARLKEIEAEIVANSAAKTKAREEKFKQAKEQRDQENDDGDMLPPESAGDPGMPMMPGVQNTASAVVARGPHNPQATVSPPLAKVRPIAVTEVMKAIQDAAAAFGRDVPFRIGKISKRTALGVFQVFPEIVRIRIANDIGTAAHELGHAIEKIIYGWNRGGPWTKKRIGRKAMRELLKLGKALYGSKQPVGGYKREGFAEFARLWITDPAEAKNQAPEFSKWFEDKFLPLSTAGSLALERAQEAYGRYDKQGAVQRAKMNIVDRRGFVERLRRLGSFLKEVVSFQGIFEEFAPFRDMERDAADASQQTRGRGLSINERPYTLATTLRGTAAARVKMMIKSAMVDFFGNTVTGVEPLSAMRPLVPASKEADFTVYLWAKRAEALLEDPLGSRNPGMTLDDAKAIIAELETPQFVRAASIFHRWNDAVLDYATQASPLFAEAVHRIRQRDPGFYLPLRREFSELERVYTTTNGTNVTAGSLAGKLKGSGRRILSPIQQAIAQAEQVVQAAHDRAVLEAVISLDRIEGMGKHVVSVPRSKVPVAQKDLSELIEVLQKKLARGNVELFDQNGNPIDATNHAGELVTFFAFARQPKAGEPIIPVWDPRAQSVKWYELPVKTYETLVPQVHRLSTAGKVIDMLAGVPLRTSAQLLRLGATGLALPFSVITNTIRDTRTLAKNSRGTHNFVRVYWEVFKMWPVALGSALSGGKFANKYIRFIERTGIKMAQSLNAQGSANARVTSEIFGRKVSFLPTLREVYDWYTDVLQFSDTAARAAEIKMVAEKIGVDVDTRLSLEDTVHLILAGKQGTTDFSATGSWTKTLGQYIPFLRSGLQGPRAAARAFKRAPAAYLLKGMVTAAFSAAIWMALKDEDWWDEVDPNDKLRYFYIPITLNGRQEILQIPVNQDADYVFGTGMIAALDSLYRDNPKAAQEWAESLTKASNPFNMPPLVDEIREQLQNKDSFTGKPIVPKEYENRKPEQQFGDRTPELAKWLGEKTGASPLRIEHAVTGLTGTVGRGSMKLASTAMTGELSGTENESEAADVPVIGRLARRGGPLGFQPRSVSEFYDLTRQAEQVKEDIKTPETASHRERRLILEDAKKALGSIAAISRVATDVDTQRALMQKRVDIAKRATELYNSSGTPNREEMTALRKAYEYKATIAVGQSDKAKKMIDNLKESAQSKPSARKKMEPLSKYRARVADHELESASARRALRLIRGG